MSTLLELRRSQSRHLHVLHVLLRDVAAGIVRFFMMPHSRWKGSDGDPYWTFPTKKTVLAPERQFQNGETVETFVDAVMQRDLGLAPDDYLLDQELAPSVAEVESPGSGEPTRYEIYPVDVWLPRRLRERLPSATGGAWLRPDEILAHAHVSPTTALAVESVLRREAELDQRYGANPADESRPDVPRRLLRGVPEGPTMDMLALRWNFRKRSGVRCLEWSEIQTMLDAGGRALNLLVADPYLSYQNQGFGLTFSFFTHKDKQDLHLHGQPTHEIYGVLSGGPLEFWWKPKHARGSSAWSRRVIEPLGWAEVEPEQCHIVRWLGEGVGVVFKAGPGQLAGVGRQGICGKTPCAGCACQMPEGVIECERLGAGGPSK